MKSSFTLLGLLLLPAGLVGAALALAVFSPAFNVDQEIVALLIGTVVVSGLGLLALPSHGRRLTAPASTRMRTQRRSSVVIAHAPSHTWRVRSAARTRDRLAA